MPHFPQAAMTKVAASHEINIQVMKYLLQEKEYDHPFNYN